MSRQLFASHIGFLLFTNICNWGLTDAGVCGGSDDVRSEAWSRLNGGGQRTVVQRTLGGTMQYGTVHHYTPAIQYSVAVQNYTRITLQHRCCEIRKYVSL